MSTTERWGPRLLPYYMAQAISMGALGSVITLLGELRDEFGLSETRLGLIVGIGFFSSFVTQLTLGKLADRGYAPLMVRAGFVAGAASMVAFALGSGFWHFMIARAVLGISVGIAQPAIRRTVILADPEHIGRNIGRLGLVEVIGFAIGPAVAALLADVGGLDLPFYTLAAIIVVIMVSMGRLEADEATRSHDDASSLQLLRNPLVVGTLVIVTSEFMMIGAYEAVWSVMLTDLGAATWEIGLSFTVFAIPLGILAPIGGSLAQRTGGLKIALAGLIASAIAGIGFGLIDTVWGLVAVSFVIGIGAGIGFPAGLFAYSRTVTDDRQASAQGLMGATEVLLGGVGSVIAAWLYDVHGRATVWFVMPAIMLLLIGVGVAVRLRHRETQRQPVELGAA